MRFGRAGVERQLAFMDDPRVRAAGTASSGGSSDDGQVPATGKVKEKRAPPKALAAASKAPWCASMMERQMARPMPMPSGLVE